MEKVEKLVLFRKRFFGRQDVYGRGWSTYRDGKLIKGFSPNCENFGVDNCHIRLKDGIPCSRCEIKKYESLNDGGIWKHITGESPLLMYLLQEDGTVHFAALDFDMKEGREKFGHTFEDVRKVCDLFTSVGLAHHVARSTGSGHHLYIFFSEGVDARKIRSLFWWAFSKVGFIQEAASGVRPLPEMFPKQGSSEGGLGNGIKPPMIESNFAKGRNCFITNNNEVIENQWGYLRDVHLVSSDNLDAIITKESIDLQSEYTATGKKGSTSKWEPPTTGSIHKVLEGCAALRKVREKCAKGEKLLHDEGFALWHMCLNVADGEQWFIDNVTDWGKTPADLQQLKQSKDRNYKPWSCKTMQDKGVCIKGTKCFDKRPPLVTENGKVREDVSVPEADWPSPSPYRYAIGKGEKYLAKLLEYIDEIVGIEDMDTKRARVKEIIEDSVVFDEDQQGILKEKIAKSGIYKKAQINKQFSSAKKEQEQRVEETLAQRTDTITVGDTIYRRTTGPWGYMEIKGVNNDNEILKPLCDFVIDILEERMFFEEEDNSLNRIYYGKFRSANYEKSFEIDSVTWDNPANFSTYFSTLVGSRWVIPRKEQDTLKLVAMAATMKDMHLKPMVQQTQFSNSPGWFGDTYLMPSVMVDKDGVRPNTTIPVSLNNKEHSRFLDFSIISDSELRDVLFHIKNDLLNAFPKVCVYNALGFTLMASIFSYLKLPYKPSMWFEGESGAGKTALCMLMQQFYGNFKGPLNWTTTSVSMINYGFEFKDCLLLVDDYKEYGNSQRAQICQNIVQNAYQYSARGASTKDGSHRKLRYARCTFMMTGEETPVNETSFIARLHMIYYPKHDTEKTRLQYQRCVEMSPLYKGITPKFIHWVLNKSKLDIKSEFEEIEQMSRIKKGDDGKENKYVKNIGNADRLAYNTAFTRLGWRLFVDFMCDNGAMDSAEKEGYLTEHWKDAKVVLSNMAERSYEEKNSIVFIHRLKELLMSGELGIEGLEGYQRERSVMIGFVEPREVQAGIGYIYPEKVLDEIKRKSATNITLNRASIAAQLRTMNLLYPGDSANTVLKRRGTGRVRVWRVDLFMLGICTKGLEVADSDAAEQLRREFSELPQAEDLGPLFKDANTQNFSDGLAVNEDGFV